MSFRDMGFVDVRCARNALKGVFCANNADHLLELLLQRLLQSVQLMDAGMLFRLRKLFSGV